MSDPSFTTRDELIRWSVNFARNTDASIPGKKLAAIKTIRRVTLAHKHLIEETGRG